METDALIIGCGFFAAFLYSKDSRTAGFAFRAGNGATVGLVAGLIYGVISGILGGLISSALGMGDWQQVIDQIQMSGADIDPEVLDGITHFMESSGGLMMILIGLFFALVFGAIFGTLGGVFIVIGVCLVIGANWGAIHPWIKISGHLVLMCACLSAGKELIIRSTV